MNHYSSPPWSSSDPPPSQVKRSRWKIEREMVSSKLTLCKLSQGCVTTLHFPPLTIERAAERGRSTAPFLHHVAPSVFMLATLHMARHQTRVLSSHQYQTVGGRGAIVFDMKVLCKTHPWRSALLYHRCCAIAKSRSEWIVDSSVMTNVNNTQFMNDPEMYLQVSWWWPWWLWKKHCSVLQSLGTHDYKWW